MKFENTENIVLKGQWQLTARHKETGEITILCGDNTIATVGRQLLGDMFIDASGYDTGLTWCALGTGTATPLVTDTKLAYEGTRKAITSRSRSGTQDTFSTFFTAAESTLYVKEVGIFGHSTATAGTNSGIIFSHYLSAFNNTSGLYDLTWDYLLSFA